MEPHGISTFCDTDGIKEQIGDRYVLIERLEAEMNRDRSLVRCRKRQISGFKREIKKLFKVLLKREHAVKTKVTSNVSAISETLKEIAARLSDEGVPTKEIAHIIDRSIVTTRLMIKRHK